MEEKKWSRAEVALARSMYEVCGEGISWPAELGKGEKDEWCEQAQKVIEWLDMLGWRLEFILGGGWSLFRRKAESGRSPLVSI